MENKELLTVSEFAEIIGISKQAVYKQLNNKLKPFVQRVENKTFINRKGLEVFQSTKLNNHSTNFQPTDNQVEQPRETEFLIKQIEEQNKTIEFQRAEIERLSKLLENQQVLLLNEQQKTTLLLSEETETKKGFFKRVFGKK